VDRALGRSVGLLEGQLKQPWVRFLDAPLVRVKQVIEPVRQVQAIEQVSQAAIGI